MNLFFCLPLKLKSNKFLSFNLFIYIYDFLFEPLIELLLCMSLIIFKTTYIVILILQVLLA